MNIEELAWGKMDALLPAIVQDAATGEVRMLGYMDRAALEATQATGKVTFFSRSKQALWVKGETSGNTLDLVSITPDCDNDALLVVAERVVVQVQGGAEAAAAGTVPGGAG